MLIDKPRLTKNDIIGMLADCPLPRNDYWIGFGGALCFYGIREVTADVDLACLPDAYQRVKDFGHYNEYVTASGTPLLSLAPLVDLHLEEIAPPTIVIDGFRIPTLDYIRRVKKLMGRPKDIIDIVAIDEYIRNND